MASCSKVRRDKEDFSKIFDINQIEADHVSIPSNPAKTQEPLPQEGQDWMDIDDIFGTEVIEGTQASQAETQVKSIDRNYDEQELLDFSTDDFEDAVNDTSSELNNKNEIQSITLVFHFQRDQQRIIKTLFKSIW